MFLASVVAAALRESIRDKNTSVPDIDLIICPTDTCLLPPINCNKGQNQSCKKNIDVIYEHDGHNKVTTLIFYYQHKNIPSEGFIEENDFAINRLLFRGVITI